MKILLTGFEPFAGLSWNPSWEAIKDLNGKHLNGFELITKRLPVTFDADDILDEEVKKFYPEIILSFGLHFRDGIAIEKQAKNLHLNEVSRKVYREVHQTNLPTKKIVRALKKKFAIKESNNAGGYVCEYILWHDMQHVKDFPRVEIAGFIHVPQIDTEEVLELQLKIIDIIKEVIKYYHELKDRNGDNVESDVRDSKLCKVSSARSDT